MLFCASCHKEIKPGDDCKFVDLEPGARIVVMEEDRVYHASCPPPSREEEH